MTTLTASPLLPPAGVVMIGLGAMGVPMALRLIAAGYTVLGVDPAEPGRMALEAAGGKALASSTALDPAQVAAVITMLPTGAIVRAALLEGETLAHRLQPGTLVIDMSSSRPADTVALEQALAPLGLPLVDAPVSGGVKRAVDGSLAIMAGGPAERVERARPLLAAMGKSIIPTGPIGSGHAMKALNNYVSAAGLVAACEALLVGRTFGLKPETIVDVLNVSTGRNNSTEVKLKPFVISESFAYGFGMALMAKDIGIAAELADELGFALPQMPRVADLWAQAVEALGKQADHTEIYRFIAPAKAGL
jgi:3-hydroxyisobutyrate dehydrogenase